MKSKKIIIAIISAILVAIVLIVTSLFAFTGLFDFTKSANKQFNNQIEKAFNSEGAKITDYSDSLEKLKEKAKQAYTMNGNLSVKLNLDSSILKKDVQKTINNSSLNFKYNVDPSNRNSQTQISLLSDKDEVISADLLVNNTTYGIKVEDIYNKYLSFNYADLLDTMLESEDSDKEDLVLVKKSLENPFGIYDLLYISKDDLKSLDKTYSNLLTKITSKDSYKLKGNVSTEVDGKNTRTNAVYLTISGKDFANIIEEFINLAKNDETTIKLLTEKVNIILEYYGEDKVSDKEVKDSIKDLYSEIEDFIDEIKEYDDDGIQFVIYYTLFTKKPVKVEVNSVSNMKEEADIENVLTAEFGKNRNIYTFNNTSEAGLSPYSIKLIDEYDKPSKNERNGILTLKKDDVEFSKTNYEIVKKNNESKIYMDFSTVSEDDDEKISLKLNLSSKGNIEKEPTDYNFNLSGEYKGNSVEVNIDGTVEYVKEVEVPTLTSNNSVDLLELDNNKRNSLIKELSENASKNLPKKLKLLGISVTEKDISSALKSITSGSGLNSSSSSTNTNNNNTNNNSSIKIETTSSENVLVASKENSDSSLGDYTETIQINFKNKKAEQFSIIMELESAEYASSIAGILNSASSEETAGFTVSSQGNKIIMTMDAKTFMEQEDIEADSLSREDLEKTLKDEGYTIK